MLPELRKQETDLALRELHQTSLDRLAIGDRRTAYVLSAMFALQAPGQAERQFSVLTGLDPNMKTNN